MRLRADLFFSRLGIHPLCDSVGLFARWKSGGEPLIERWTIVENREGYEGATRLTSQSDFGLFAESVTSLRAIFMKSVVAARDLEKGSVLKADDLTSKKPGTGIPAVDLVSLVGRRLRRAVERDDLLAPDDLEAP